MPSTLRHQGPSSIEVRTHFSFPLWASFRSNVIENYTFTFFAEEKSVIHKNTKYKMYDYRADTVRPTLS
jgi:hypothetical protein